MSYIQDRKDGGAQLVTGGGRVGGRGYYIQPTVFADVQVGAYLIVLDSFLSICGSSVYHKKTC